MNHQLFRPMLKIVLLRSDLGQRGKKLDVRGVILEIIMLPYRQGMKNLISVGEVTGLLAWYDVVSNREKYHNS